MHVEHNALAERAREMMQGGAASRAHRGHQPFASHHSGPMRRDYRLARFISLAHATRARRDARAA